MAWWDGLWLNEGFASYMEYQGTNSVEPDWNMVRLLFGEYTCVLAVCVWFF